jgi:RNA polymerase sigma factor (sigma-70 family)
MPACSCCCSDDIGGKHNKPKLPAQRHSDGQAWNRATGCASLGGPPANPLGRLQDQRMREALVEAIKNLPEREQYVMSMHYEHDMNLKEIAVVLKVTESRVCQLHGQSIARPRTRLREW